MSKTLTDKQREELRQLLIEDEKMLEQEFEDSFDEGDYYEEEVFDGVLNYEASTIQHARTIGK